MVIKMLTTTEIVPNKMRRMQKVQELMGQHHRELHDTLPSKSWPSPDRALDKVQIKRQPNYPAQVPLHVLSMGP